MEAKSFFEEMPEGNLLTWTVMISGLAQNGFGGWFEFIQPNEKRGF